MAGWPALSIGLLAQNGDRHGENGQFSRSKTRRVNILVDALRDRCYGVVDLCAACWAGTVADRLKE
jgi:hypothetical protein